MRITKHKSARDWYGELALSSRIVVKFWGGRSVMEPLGLVYISLGGGISAVPSMKNRKIPGLNMPNPRVIGQMKLMTDLYLREAAGRAPKFDEKVALLIVAAARSRSFDLDGVTTSICDWLEPAGKLVGKARRPRCWGIGLIPNDSWIVPLTIPAEMTSFEPTRTHIIVRPLSKMRGSIQKFAEDFIS